MLLFFKCHLPSDPEASNIDPACLAVFQYQVISHPMKQNTLNNPGIFPISLEIYMQYFVENSVDARTVFSSPCYCFKPSYSFTPADTISSRKYFRSEGISE